MALDVTLVDLYPENEYEGVAYEQRVVIRPSGGNALGAFDPDFVLDESLLGAEISVEVSLLVGDASLEHVKETERGITPNTGHPRGYHHHTYSGRVVDVTSVDERLNRVTLDVGCGTVYFYHPTSADTQVRPGEFVRVTPVRTDIAGR